MAHARLIPCLLLKNGLIVRSQLFSIHQIIGNPISTVHRLSNWSIDELIVLDISDDDYHDMRRDDLFMRYSGSSTIDILKSIADVCFMPLAFGGRIRTLEDMHARLSVGADKCVINSEAFRRPKLIEEAARRFGSQCVVVSIDGLRHPDGRLEVMIGGGKEATGVSPADWARQAEAAGAGEIFLNSVDRDGSGWGYDIDLVKAVTSTVSIPVIACGGVGSFEDFSKGILEGGASAVAAANIFHFFELSYPLAKKACLAAGVDMRPASADNRWFPREPVYDVPVESVRLSERLERARRRLGSRPITKSQHEIRWCAKCVYPAINAAPMEFDADGVCMGCRMASSKIDTSLQEWQRREQLLVDILKQNRSRDGTRHDCVIGVSGGKDSYFQTHYIKNVLGFNPLLVTYYGNNYSEVGQRNLMRMKEAFGVDHMIYQPSVDLLKKLNRLGFEVMGDMNWHNHIGIATIPMKMAAQFDIPIVIWGEHGYADLCGQYSMNDFVEWSYRNRLEHFARGFEWNYMVGRAGITAQDMFAYQYPSDRKIMDIGLRGLYLSNYVYWESNEHSKLVVEKYGFEYSDEPFDRTYRKMSNLDDIHENGVHDYMKFIKFGYGRCTDHATKDVRAGLLGRGQAIDLVRKYDHVKPRDLSRWLGYVGMTEEEFDAIADTFRDQRIWGHDGHRWVKKNIWDEDVR